MWGCANGTCSVICPMPKTACDNMACVDVQTDVNNCGMCDNACQQNESCVQGMCCPMGQSVCNMMCVDMQGDPMNCGKCGQQCSGQTPVCSKGVCVAGCASPNDVQYNGKCYYLDGSLGVCDNGYTLSNNAALAAILKANPNAWQGKNYHKTISGNCCVETS